MLRWAISFCVAGLALAQTPGAFEAASIRANPNATSIGNRFTQQTMDWTGVPLRNLIQNAFGIRPYQLAGGPNWASSDRWDLEAKTESRTTTQEKFQMLQDLLQDRFQLKFHWETKDIAGYNLVVAKSGSKLRIPAQDASRQPGLRNQRGLIDGHAVPVDMLAAFLSAALAQPVADSTGLTGDFDYKIQWQADELGPAAGDAPDPGPSLFTAIQDQLGLKLEAVKVPTRILVIDSVQKPSPN